jgi:hypothetical protein
MRRINAAKRSLARHRTPPLDRPESFGKSKRYAALDGAKEAHMARTPSAAMHDGKVPLHWKVAGTLFRSIFLVGLVLTTARISLPDTMNSAVFAHLSAADFARGAIGIVVCGFLIAQLFRRPQDDHGYKAWALIGLALCAVAIFVIAVHGGFPNLA